MQVPRSVIENYTRGINGISEKGRAALAEMLERVDFLQDVAIVRSQVVQAMQTVCGASAEATAMLANEFYDGLRTLELGAPLGGHATSGRDPAATDGSVRSFAKKLDDGKVDAFKNLCLGRVDYECKVAAAQTCLNKAKLDPRAPRFARVAFGETCDFCLMLASRGWVYHTEAAASHSHANCDCRVVPSWKAHSVEGYDPAALYDQWQDAVDEKAARRAERNGTTEEHERDLIMAAYSKSSGRAHHKAYRPEKEPNYVDDEKSAKMRGILGRKMRAEADDKTSAMRAILKFDDAWNKNTHSVDEDNAWAKRVNNLMVEHGISLADLGQFREAYYANAI